MFFQIALDTIAFVAMSRKLFYSEVRTRWRRCGHSPRRLFCSARGLFQELRDACLTILQSFRERWVPREFLRVHV